MQHQATPSGQRAGADALQRLRSPSGGATLPDPLLFACLLIAVIGGAAGALQLTVVGVMVLAVVLISRLWARLSLEHITLERTFSRRRVFRGDVLRIDIVVENRKPLPLPWLKLSFLLPDGLATVAPRDGQRVEDGISFYETFSLARYERVRAERSIVARHRGCYRLGVAHVESGDLFGLYTSRAEGTSPRQELVVFPLPRPLPGFELPPRVPDGEVRGPATMHEDYSRPNGAREYRPGDPLRTIDWKTTARMRRPYVRTFEPSNGHQIVVLLECSTSEQLWRFRPERLEAAVAAAASVCVLGIEAGHQVGLVANGLPVGSGWPIVWPGAGDRQLDAMMHSLARVQPMPTRPLERLYVEHAEPALARPRELTLVYVTARCRDDTFAMLARRCQLGATARGIYVGAHPLPDPDFMQMHDFSAHFDEGLSATKQRESVLYA